MPDVKDIINLLTEQELQRQQRQEAEQQREVQLQQRHGDIDKLQRDLSVALRNRDYSKNLLIEQLQREPSSHGGVIAKLLADTFEAIFLFKHPNADERIKALQQQIETLKQQQQ